MTGDAAVLPLVGKKLMSKLGGMANESAAAEVSDFARRQMEKMGWSAGKGLGKNEQGVKSHVKVKRREELQGVGAEKQEVKEQANQWWYNVYDRMASKIVVDASSDEEGEKKKKKEKKKEKKRKRDQKTLNGQKFRIPTDEELFAATGGKLFGRRAYGSCNGKLKRDEMQLKKSKKHEKDSEEPVTTSSDTNDEEDKEKLRKKAKKTARKLKKKAKKDKKEQV
ncbi:hypothetical protein JG687_00015158 [Phytophthora cactorum]|uniref:G-patch domain-containing protein n=1 Tax=Phytophthora cactorum TaxID=29920 RepID=A0A8T1TXJ1_9STRA|nr:hypothetical protein PC120_g17614 [Phytophthora cactorum]KAG3050923.1 hypothetical protein PC121_g18106 [Phytophthora cactorum]KAG3191370.1 hypothetical protein PC128_g10950 [Phytophthora cactorum]KAG4046543.1 hypothetical protein PC123_g18077 [Phytophthora cactorum]KAG6948964.1 hypothetical protein JG687_00015158 [Phytophthora cactorum]